MNRQEQGKWDMRVCELEEGVYLVGEYRGKDKFRNDRGTTVRMDVLTGRNVCSVYMTDDGGAELDKHESGEDVIVRARPYVNNRNFLTWGSGQVVAWLSEDETEAVKTA